MTMMSHRACLSCPAWRVARLSKTIKETIKDFRILSKRLSKTIKDYQNVSQSLFELPCLTGRKGRDGTFPASACIKLTGIYDDTGEVRLDLVWLSKWKGKGVFFILRLCEIYNTTSQGDDSARVFPWLGHSHDRHRADENQQLWCVLLWREVRYRIHRSFYISSHVSSGLDISYL